MYSALTGQFRRYMGHVTKNIGGIYDTPKTYDMEGNQFVIVPKTIQKEAVTFLNTQLFATPKWLMDQNIFSKLILTTELRPSKEMQKSTLNSVLAGDRMVRLMEASSQGKEYYSVDELTDLRNGIFSELKQMHL
jgi:hypothetical protein